MLSCVKQGKTNLLSGVMCDQSYKMVGQEPLSPDVRVFMTEEEALFYEFECGDSQHGSSSEGALLTAMPSARALF